MISKSTLTRSAGLVLSLLLLAAGNRAQAQTPTVILGTQTVDFSYQQGTAVASPQRVQVFSNPASLPFTVTAVPPVTWLSFTTTGNTATSPLVQIIPVPGTLAPGTYSTSLQVQVQGAAAQNIFVTLFVSASPQLVPSPPDLVTLTAQTGTRVISPVLVLGSSGSVAFTFTASAVVNSGIPWLSVAPTTAISGSTLSVQADATNLLPNVYQGVITLTTQQTPVSRVTIPVIFNVTAGPTASTIQVAPSAFNFAFQPGFQAPLPRPVTITSASGTQFSYLAQVTGAAFLSLSQNASGAGPSTALSQTTGSPLYLVVTPPSAPGTYDATLTINPQNGSPSATIPVRLVVANGPLVTSTPDAVTFNYQLGNTTPGTQTVTVQSTSGLLPFSVAATTAGTSGDWLTVLQGGVNTPGNITVGLNQTRLLQLAAGQYTGAIVVTATGAANSPYSIPVTLNISGSAFLVIDPTSLDFGNVTPNGVAPSTRSIAVRSTDGTNQGFQISIPNEFSWISVANANVPLQTGLTGTTVNVNVSPSSLPNVGGRLEGAIVVTPIVATGTPAPAQRVPVFVTVAAANTLAAAPATLTFNQVGVSATGVNNTPASQTVAVSTPLQGISFTARTDQSFLTVTPTSGPLNTTLTVSVNGTGLNAGTYTGNVIVTASGANDLRIPVTFTIAPPVSLTLAPTSLSFTAQIGSGATPPAQNVVLTSSTVTTFTAAAATTTGGNWLTVTPTSGTTAAGTGGATSTLAVNANPVGLAAGTYTGTITITGATSTPQVLNVTLTVAAPATPLISSVNNAATNAPTTLSPGLIIAIKGSNLGGATGVASTASTPGTNVGTTTGEVRVLFDGIPAPVLFSRQDQVNTIVPYEVFGRSTTRVVVEFRGTPSAALDLRVDNTAPGIFTLDASGRGPGAILNQNNSVNGVNNPAARGSVIVIYATGEGQTSAAGTTGRIILPALTDLRRPTAPVSVTIGGAPAAVEYAGSAPGLVSGAFQINVRLPGTPGAATAPVTMENVIVTVGSASSLPGVTVAVR